MSARGRQLLAPAASLFAVALTVLVAGAALSLGGYDPGVAFAAPEAPAGAFASFTETT